MAEITNSPDGGVSEITFAEPFEGHAHFRDDGNENILATVLPATARQFSMGIAMPNLRPPVTTTVRAVGYHGRILAALPDGVNFTPLMTLYATDGLLPDEIMRAKDSGIVHGVKLYPKGATTNSNDGVTDIKKIYSALECMQREGMPLLVHGEVTDQDIDIFDREAVFIERVLGPLLRDFPELRVVFEHATTKDAVDFVKAAGENVAATITAHHLLLNRNHLLVGGIRPHYYCLPVLKREIHREALVHAATSGNTSFFLGTDTAPHFEGAKQSACGCAGCYTAESAVELYLRVFEMMGELENFEKFVSLNGPSFYRLPCSTKMVTYKSMEKPWHLPHEIKVGESGKKIIPFTLTEGLHWIRTS